MNLRKIFNYPNDEQKRLINLHVQMMKDLAEKEEKDNHQKEWDNQTERNSSCPNCRKTNIVNKITRVQGEGSVGGSFSLGFGSIYGSSSTDTNGVNHCNSCGNQWKKYKCNYKYNRHFYANWINDINRVRNGEKKWTFSKDEVEMLKELKVSAEAIFVIKELAGSESYMDAQENVTLGYLRTLFPSVYDVENK